MSQANCDDGYLDGFDGVLDLENASFWGEGVYASIVVAPTWMRMYLVLNILDILNSILKNI